MRNCRILRANKVAIRCSLHIMLPRFGLRWRICEAKYGGRSERQNKQLGDKVNRRGALSRPQERAIGSRDTSNESLPILNQKQTQMHQIQQNQENQMRMMQSNAPRNVPGVQQSSSSRTFPSAPPLYNGQPPSYDSVVYGPKD